MASSHGDGGIGSNGGTTDDRVHTRTRKREKARERCLLCVKAGRKSRLQLFQIGPNEAMYLCTEEKCPYPVSMTDDIHGSVVTRELSELKISSPPRGSSEKSKPLKSFPTSMPIVVPVESQKIPTIPREDMIPKRTSSLVPEPLEEQLLQFRLWMREKKHLRNNSLPHEEGREKGDGFATKRARVRSRQPEFVTDSEFNQVKLISHTNKLPGQKTRITSTSSIRKIDKTLMQASGVDFNKKFEPFTITPQEKLSKESASRSPEPESSSENKDTDANTQIATAQLEDPIASNTQTETTQEGTTQSNENLIEPSHDTVLATQTTDEPPSSVPLHPAAGILPVDSLQMPLGPQEQWQHPSTQPGNSVPLHNGDISNSLYSTNLIPPPQYMDGYHMMPSHPHYNNLIPPPTSYPAIPPSLQSPLSPIPQDAQNAYPSQFYYSDNVYQYADQWDDNQAQLELTKMLDSLDMPPSEQYDPTLGILSTGSPTGADMYDLMDPTISPNLTGPYERPHPVMQVGMNPLTSPLNDSIPVNANTPDMPSSQVVTQISDVSQEKALTDIDALKELPASITNGHMADSTGINGVGTFNNTEESPMSSYHSPQSEGEYQSMSLVGSAS